jgi:ankyrin repeat protein
MKVSGLIRAARFLLPMAAGLMVVATPAQAQFSTGYKFLEAVKKKDGEKVNTMLDAPGTTIVNTRDVTSGETGLHIVTTRRDLTWMSFLLGKGANPNLKDVRGRTPLSIASDMGFVEGVQLLVTNNARVDESNDAGETPLIAAVHRRQTEMMRILLKAGANPDRADNSGRTARDYALLDGADSQLVSIIKENAKPRAAGQSNKPTYGPSF